MSKLWKFEVGDRVRRFDGNRIETIAERREMKDGRFYRLTGKFHECTLLAETVDDEYLLVDSEVGADAPAISLERARSKTAIDGVPVDEITDVMTTYWLVHGAGPTDHRHATHAAAAAEADRLSAKHPGTIFAICQAIEARRTSTPKVEKILLVVGADDDLPL